MASIACIPSTPPPENAADLRERARGALLGLAVGDALGAPAENMLPSEIRARWGRITGYVTDTPAGTDDTEYAIFSGLLLARHGSALTPAHVEAAWHLWIADRAEGPFRGAGFSERGTLENLRRGLAAPISARPSAVHEDAGLDWSRSRVIVAARAAGLPPPSQSVHPDIRDLEGLAASCAHGRALGFLGRTAIHPRQLPVIERAYLHTRREIEEAETIVKAATKEQGVQALPDGRFIDAAVVSAAHRTLSLARRH